MKLVKTSGGTGNRTDYWFWCPACKELHNFTQQDVGVSWSFDGNMESPTFSPSLRYLDGTRCHLHLTNGKITYCSDCPHDHAGKTIELPDIPADHWLTRQPA